MAQLTQDKRAAQLQTPLGKDVLVLASFVAAEGLSELFEFNVEALSERENINFDDAIGRACTIKQITYDDKIRYYNGILTATRRTGTSHDLFHYHLVLRPWLWLLGRKADCRIFLQKDVKEIISDVFRKAGFTDFVFRTTGDYPKIPYCVQYRETDLAFCSRMMEHYGIYYFFEHADGKHTLVMADARTSHKAIPDLPKLPFIERHAGAARTEQHVHSWVSDRQLRTGKVHFNDYDYLQPRKNLKAPKESEEKYAHSKLEMYDYHHKYDEKDKGERHAQFRLEAEQAYDYRRRIHGDAASIHPGGLVTVERHPTASENQEYLIVGARHMYSSQQYGSGGGGTGDTYSGSYDILPSNRPYRSLPNTPKPRIYGIQTAKVVGKKGEEGEEISTDEHGHIWVQFHWDREPQKSCPVRVAQSWAGKQWGAIFLPRIRNGGGRRFPRRRPGPPHRHGLRLQRRQQAALRSAGQQDHDRLEIGLLEAQWRLQRVRVRRQTGLGKNTDARRTGSRDHRQERRDPNDRRDVHTAEGQSVPQHHPQEWRRRADDPDG